MRVKFENFIFIFEERIEKHVVAYDGYATKGQNMGVNVKNLLDF